jgi:hypothetical protein
MSKDARKDIVLIVIFSLVSATGMASVFLGYRLLAWIVIGISDLYLFIVLLLAAHRAEDDGFLDRHPWVTGVFPRKPAGILVVTLLFLAIVSGFAGLLLERKSFRPTRRPSMRFMSASSSWDSPTTRRNLVMVSLL